MTPSIRLSLLPWLALLPWLLFTPAAADAAPGGPAPKPNKLAAPAVEAPPPSSMTFSVVNAAGRFDLSVNNAPAAQVYMQLGYDTPYNVLVNPDVTGTISITLKNTNVLEAMESSVQSPLCRRHRDESGQGMGRGARRMPTVAGWHVRLP